MKIHVTLMLLTMDANGAKSTTSKSSSFTSLSEQKYRTMTFETACMRLQRGQYSVNGYRQSFRYFSDPAVVAELRREFAFRDPSVRAEARAWLRDGAATLGLDAERGEVYFVGVHFRWEMARHKVGR